MARDYLSSVSLSSLLEEVTESRTELVRQLSQRGFALLSIQRLTHIQALDRSLEVASELAGFRFPPINVDTVTYDDAHRDAFRALYAIATGCLGALAQSDDLPAPLIDQLFCTSPHEPLASDHPYAGTFFNLFNYDHGALNPHLDRGLVTIIHLRPAKNREGSSVLWVRGSDNTWCNADDCIRQCMMNGEADVRYALILIGEDGAAFLKENLPSLYPAEHSVRVQPSGPWIDHSHHRPDPETLPKDNRLSAAMILKAGTWLGGGA